MSKGALKLAGLLGAAAALGLATPARAAMGDGIKLGGSDARLHPFVELGGGYDTNALYRNPGDGVADGAIWLRPGFTWVQPGELVTLELGAAVQRKEHLGETRGRLPRHFGEAYLGLDVNKGGALALSLEDRVQRSMATTAVSFGQAVRANLNELSIAAPWRPGGGALQLTPYGEWIAESFEKVYAGSPCAPGSPELVCADLSKFSYNELRGGAELRWRFLPRTALLLDSSYFARLPNTPRYGAAPAGVRVEAGGSGLVTNHFAATVKGGYGFITEDDRPGKLPRFRLLTVEGEWLPTEGARAKLGYTHDFGADPNQPGLYGAHRVSAEANWAVLRVVGLRLAGVYENRSYFSGGRASPLVRSEVFYVEPSIEGSVTRWLKLAALYGYTSRNSKLPTTANQLPGFDYTRSEASLRATVTY